MKKENHGIDVSIDSIEKVIPVDNKKEKEEWSYIEDVAIITVRDKYGNIKSQHTAHHSITKYGMAAMAGLVGNTGSITAFGDLGIGTGTTGDTINDSQLQTSPYIKAATVSRVAAGTYYANDTLQFECDVANSNEFSHAHDASLTGTWVIDEIGVFNGTVNGTSIMLLHIAGTTNYGSTGDSCNWDQGDTYSLTVKVVFRQGS